MTEAPTLPGERAAGAFVYRAGPFAAWMMLAVALAASMLVPLGLWRPVIAMPVVGVGVAAAWRLAASVPFRPVPVWVPAVSVLVGAGGGIWAGMTRGEHVVLRRDPGSYALFAHWIATHHGLPVNAHLDAFGGAAALAVPGFSVASPAYYQVLTGTGVDVVPQFLLGAPALDSLGWWAGGWGGLLLVPAIVGGFALLATASLTARLVGPRWAALAAASLGLTFPVLHVARTTYSEPAALLLVVSAASLAWDAVRSGASTSGTAAGTPSPVRWLGLAAGATLGLAGLVRVNSLREVALLLPVCGVLALRRHPAAAPLAQGAIGGTLIAALPAVGLSRPYLASIAGSLLPLLAIAVLLGGGSLIAVVISRRRTPTRAEPRPSDHARGQVIAAAGVIAVGVLVASRPLWQVVRQDPHDAGSRYVAGLQLGAGLPVDGGRTYAEHSLQWVLWWTGPVMLLVAWLTLAVLAAHTVRWWTAGAGSVPPWLLPAVVGFGSTLLTLYRPGITPDHPWADRRLVPVVLPTVVLAATAGAAWSGRWARRRMPATLLVAVAAMGVVVLLVPPVMATWPLATMHTERGELAAVRTVCAAFRPGDAVVAIDARAQNEWPQVVRGICGHPAASLRFPTVASLDRLAALVQAKGGRLVLLAAGGRASASSVFAPLGVSGRQVVDLHTVEDARVLTTRPRTGSSLSVEVWLADWPAQR